MSKLERTNVFAQRLWDLADQHKITVAEIGRRAGLPNINMYFTKDRHQPTIPVIVAIAKAMNVSADYLCGMSETVETYTEIDITECKQLKRGM